MNVTVEALPRSQSRVTVEIEPERMAQAREEAITRLAREVVVPGFRKGKAPRRLVERYLNSSAIEEEAEGRVMDEVWRELRDGQLKDVTLFDSPRVKILQHNPLLFEIILTLPPSVQLGDYKGIRIAPELVTVTEEDVDKLLENTREQYAQWAPVTHRPVRAGDLVTLQFHGRIGNQAMTSGEDITILIGEETDWLVPGFAMRLVNMELDQEQEFTVTIPDDHPNKMVAGGTGVLHITIKDIKEKVLPALDDELAKTLGSENLAALRERARSATLAAREEQARDRMEEQILDKVAEISTVSFPDVMTDAQVDSMVEDRRQYLRQRGLDLDMYLRTTKMTMEQVRANLRPAAERRIRNFLLVEELARAEGIVVEESAVATEVERLVAQQQDAATARRELSTNRMHEDVKQGLRVKALFDRLIAIVTEGQEPVGTQANPEEVKDKGEEKPKLIIATH